MSWKCLVITPFGWLNCDCVCTLLLWGLLPLVVCKCLQVFSLSAQDVNFFRIDFWVSNAKLIKNPPRLSSEHSRAIYLVLKTASRDAEEVIKVSSYTFLGFHQLQKFACLENLLFPLLTLVGDQAPRKDDGTDFGYILIQSKGLIALELKC